MRVSPKMLTLAESKSEAYDDWIAFYFCKDSRGDEYAVYPEDVRNRNGNTVVGSQTLYTPIGSYEDYKKDYILDMTEPIPLDEVENSAIYKKLDDGEDRYIIAIDKKDAERIMNSSNPLSELKKVVNEYDIFTGESKMKKCSMQKKIESLAKKNERGTTNIETYDGFEELIGYADAEYLLEDVVDVLSKYYTYEGEGDDIVFDEDQAKDDPEFTIKIEGGDERADYYYENVFYVHLPSKEAAEELADVLGGNVSESKKRSEKRTVTIPAVSYDVFTFDELSDQAKETAREKVRDRILQWRGDSSDVFTDSCVTTLNELFPNSDLNVQYSLSYCQGDGFNTSGKLKVDDLLNVDLTAYPLNGSGIKPLEDKEAIKAACEKADVTSLDLPENRRYGYSMADRIEVVPYYEVELTDGETALLNELEKFAQDVMGRINRQLEDDGYDWFYEVTDEDIQDEISSQELEFTEDGEIE